MAINKESVEIINSKFFKKLKSLLANNANMHYLLLFNKMHYCADTTGVVIKI